MGGPDRAPHTPHRSARPGEAVTVLDLRRASGAPIWPPIPPTTRPCAIRRLVTGDADLRARFDAEVRTAGLQLGERDYELLFAMWVEHLPQREALRAALPGPDEEPLA